MANSKPRKLKKCRVCRDSFKPYRTTQRVCGVNCAIKDAENAREKIKRRELRKAKQALKTKSQLLNEAQVAFNRYIRIRDKKDPCISCGTTNPNIQYAAGHYLTRGGHPELRFNELNVHKQCNKSCNLALSGNIAAYRINLKNKIGAENLAWLEGPHDAVHLTRDQIIEIKRTYSRKARELDS